MIQHGAGRRAPAGRWKGRLAALAACVLILASVAEAVFTLNGLTVSDPLTREVVERYTLARNLQPVRFLGTMRVADWLLDRPDLAATLARHCILPWSDIMSPSGRTARSTSTIWAHCEETSGWSPAREPAGSIFARGSSGPWRTC